MRLDGRPAAQLMPQAKERLLDGVVGLLVGQALASDKAEQGLAMSLLDVDDDSICIVRRRRELDDLEPGHAGQCGNCHARIPPGPAS